MKIYNNELNEILDQKKLLLKMEKCMNISTSRYVTSVRGLDTFKINAQIASDVNSVPNIMIAENVKPTCITVSDALDITRYMERHTTKDIVFPTQDVHQCYSI